MKKISNLIYMDKEKDNIVYFTEATQLNQLDEPDDFSLPEYSVMMIKDEKKQYIGIFQRKDSMWLIMDGFSLCVTDYINDDDFDTKYSEIETTEDLFSKYTTDKCIKIFEKFNPEEFKNSIIRFNPDSDIDKEIHTEINEEYRFELFFKQFMKQYKGKTLKLYDSKEYSDVYLTVDNFMYGFDEELKTNVLYICGPAIVITSDPGLNITRSLNIKTYDEFSYSHKLGIIYDYIIRWINKDANPFDCTIIDDCDKISDDINNRTDNFFKHYLGENPILNKKKEQAD